MALSITEREKIKMHLGYLNVQVGNAISLGLPSASQLLFILERSFDDVRVEAEPLVRRAVKELDCILDQVSAARDRLQTSSVDKIEFRGPEEIAELESQYDHWAKRLADMFGVPINPFSKAHARYGQQSILIEPC